MSSAFTARPCFIAPGKASRSSWAMGNCWPTKPAGRGSPRSHPFAPTRASACSTVSIDWRLQRLETDETDDAVAVWLRDDRILYGGPACIPFLPNVGSPQRPLRDVKFPRSAVVGAVLRNGELLIPGGTTLIQPGDRTVVFALPDAMNELDRLFG